MKKIKDKIHRWRENSRIFLFYFAKYRRYYVFGILSLVVVDGLEAIPPLLLKSAIDNISAMSYGPELRKLLLHLTLGYLAIAFVQGLMRYFWRKYIIRTSMYSSHDMRVDLFNHLSAMAPGFFQKKRVGDLVSLSTNDIESVRNALGPGALVLADAFFYFLAIPPIMFWISPSLATLAFLPLLVMPFFVRRMEALIQSRFREVQERFSDLASLCQEALGGVRIVKGSSLEKFKAREFSALGENYQEANLKAARTQAGLSGGLEAILSVSTVLLFAVGGAYVIGERISLGVFVAFTKYIQKLSWPMEAVGLAANIFQRSIASQKRVDEVMLVEAGIIEPAEPKRLERAKVPAIEVRNLSFAYPGSSRSALQSISFSVPPGKRVGIAGGVGSGKSTLLSCLARLVNVPAGTIFFDGVDVTELPFSEVRERIAFVPQESFLFSRTVEDNVLYGSKDFNALDKSVRTNYARKAAGLAGVDSDMQALPCGYATVLGERGRNLSGGQRQRLTIARAIAREPKVLLLDDCLSAVDAETEQRVVTGVTEASAGISMLVSSHRISSFRGLDWLIVMNEGEIVAQGRPADLVRSNETLVELARQERLERMDLLK
jgi:ATP-binding cassette subfamily B multidrug efflux pump